MDGKDAEFLKGLLATFKVEAEEHIKALSSGLIELEKVSDAERQASIIEAVFREAHSLKGAARAVTAAQIETVCQSLEDIFSDLKHGDVQLTAELFDLLHRAVDALGALLQTARPGRTEGVSAAVRELVDVLRGARQGYVPPAPPAAKADGSLRAGEGMAVLTETVRVSTAKLDAVLRGVEELLSAKLAAGQRTAELREIQAVLASWRKQRARLQSELRGGLPAMAGRGGPDGEGAAGLRMRRLQEFLDGSDAFARSFEGRLASLAKTAEQDRRALGQMVDHLLAETRNVLMLPFSSFLDVFPKFVRDLTRDQGKEADLTITGGEVEIDRRVLEAMKDPLIHLVRNCIDHGIEKPEERALRGKPRRGTITLAVTPRDAAKVDILVADDGAGIDVEKVRASALKAGFLSHAEATRRSEQEVLPLIFQSGLSTSPFVTDISGRGLGLAIVRGKVEELGGTVSFETHPGAGTTFRVTLPLTLTAFRGVLVGVAAHRLVLPTRDVERLVRVTPEEIKTVESRETIELDGQAVSLVRLSDVLNISGKERTAAAPRHTPAVVLASSGMRIAFLVEEILDEQEVLLKPLARPLLGVPFLAGAAVLGSGRVVPIVDVRSLMQAALRVPAVRTVAAAAETEAATGSVLVVEDSITTRTLLKNILESAGYHVTTAVDGVDALTTLKTTEIDLIVTDIDMPRMDGFDLTTTIRADMKLADLPVVLVTALESREDRERGITVGASAYIVKSSFDQSNLLDVVRRLL